MPLIFDKAPEKVHQTLKTELTRLAPRLSAVAKVTANTLQQSGIADRAPHIARGILNFLRPDREQQSSVLPVHVIGLDVLATGAAAAGTVLRASLPRIWTHLLTDDGGRTTAQADVHAESSTLAALTEGPSITALGTHLDSLIAEEHDGPDRKVAVLRIPAMHLVAIWLKGATIGDDLIIPAPGPIAPLQPGRRYTLLEFLETAVPMAVDRIRQTNRTNGG